MEISQIKNRIQLANMALTYGLLNESIKLFNEIITIQSNDDDVFSDLTFLLAKIVSFKFELNLNIESWHTVLHYNTPDEKRIAIPYIINDLVNLKKTTKLDSWILKAKLYNIINFIENFDFDKWIDDYASYNWGSTMQKENDSKNLLGKLYNKKSKLNFGKCKGLSVNEIILKDPGLLIWYHDNLTHFYLNWDIVLDINFINSSGANYFEFVKRFIFKTSVFYKHFEIELLFIEAHGGREEKIAAQDERNKELARDGYRAAFEFDPDNQWNID
jgi:hypothetical protein